MMFRYNEKVERRSGWALNSLPTHNAPGPLSRQAAIKDRKMNEQQIIRQARELITKGKTKEAVERASEIARSEHASPDGLCAVAAVFREAGLAVADVAGLFRRCLQSKPDYEIASVGLVDCLLSANRYGEAIDEIDRYAQLTNSGCYERLATELAIMLDLPPGQEGQEHGFGLESREARGLKPRFNANRNPLDHLRGLEKKQDQLRKHGKGEGIRSKGKSQQDFNNELGRIKSVGDAHESPITYSRDDEE